MDFKYLELKKKDSGYEYVSRKIGNRGAVVIIPYSYRDKGNIKLVTIFSERPTFSKPILEFPAGLLDIEDESIENAALRELYEETGYRGKVTRTYQEYPSSAGLTDEVLYIVCVDIGKEIFKKPDSQRLDGSEKITVNKPMTPSDLYFKYVNNEKYMVSSRMLTFLLGNLMNLKQEV